jgi:fructose/tagatose bisphosphate aldolase
MPICSIDVLMQRAVRGRYALGYFESWNLESLQGVIDAAEQTRSPVIIGFNGGFLTSPSRWTGEGLGWYAALGRAAGESASVPCGLLFNECPCDESLWLAIKSGFNLVMPADPDALFAGYSARVAHLTRFAHAHGVAVEAELGELPAGLAGHGPAAGSVTDPAQAEGFAIATGIDLLAVSVGNVHVKVDGTKDLDLGRLEQIHRRLSIPLVLHGGTGIAAQSLRQAITLGVAKVNFGTYLKQRYLKAVRNALELGLHDPHQILGMGGDGDILVAGRLAVRDAVLERIGLLGCCGRADEAGMPS